MSQMPFGFSPNAGDGQPFDINSLGAMLQQLGAAMQRMESDGADDAVSWSTITDVARQTVSTQGDPSILDSQRKAVTDAVELAQLWLNEWTSLPASTTKANAWSRSEWIVNTVEQWKPVIEPIAAGMSATISNMTQQSTAALGDLPADAQSMLAPLMGMAKKMSSVTTGMQIGQGLGALSAEVMAAGEIGLPLVHDFTPTLLPNHIAAFAEELQLPVSDVMMLLALREVAIERLFHAHPWLRTEVSDSLARYARGISFDQEAIREAMSGIDPSDPSSMQELMGSGIFQPATSDEQHRALDHIEFMVALIDGWVSYVSGAAARQRIGSFAALDETMNRRRVSGPAQATFANLLGLELSPALMRQSASFWTEVAASLGIEGMDALFSHPDFLPTREDLGAVDHFLTARQTPDEQ